VLGTGRVRLCGGLGSGRGPGFAGYVLSGGGVIVFWIGRGRDGGLGVAPFLGWRCRRGRGRGLGGLLGREPGDVGLRAPRAAPGGADPVGLA